MKYRDFQGIRLSTLGFGTMRFPLNSDGTINEELTQKLIDEAYAGGVNYYDTAFPYLDGRSEGVTAKCLAKYPRDTYYLADKMPGHQFIKNLDPKKIFEMELERLGTGYIDFYLLHNVNDSCIDVYTDEELGIIRYLLEEKKKKGRIRWLGFSAHATCECLRTFLEYCREHAYPMDFCQIQLNYLDFSLQKAEEKLAILKEYGLPVWVMEPNRGGKLANLDKASREKLAAFETGRSDASWSFRWILQNPDVRIILSGMNSEEQVKDNLATFDEAKPLTKEENEALYEIAEGMKKSVPCTGCRYCVDACPAGINIPFMMEMYNDYSYDISMEPAVLLEAYPKAQWPAACLSCGACAARCPQHIDIPVKMHELAAMIEKGIDWRALCEKRNALAGM